MKHSILLVSFNHQNKNMSPKESWWYQVAFFSWLEFFTDCLILPFLIKRYIEPYPLPFGYSWIQEFHPQAGLLTLTFDTEDQAMQRIKPEDRTRIKFDFWIFS